MHVCNKLTYGQKFLSKVLLFISFAYKSFIHRIHLESNQQYADNEP